MPLTIPPNNIDNSAIPGDVQDSPRTTNGDPGVGDENKFGRWKSTVSATAKLLLHGVRESADAFGPLKAVAGGLCFILENYEVWAPFAYYTIYGAYGNLSKRSQTNKQLSRWHRGSDPFLPHSARPFLKVMSRKERGERS